jgi:hypothetical protein
MSTQAKTLPATRYYAETNREDWAISELAQKGISSSAHTRRAKVLPSAFDQWILEHERRTHG